MPDTLTYTVPLFPAEAATAAVQLGQVVLETEPSLVRVKLPALIVTFPALPLPEVCEPIPSNMEEMAPTVMSTVAAPTAVTETFPAFPVPLARVPSDVPESTVSAPTETATSPPMPAPRLCESMFALLCRTSSPATIEIAPALPGFEAVEDVVEEMPVEAFRAGPPSAITEFALTVIRLPLPLAWATLVNAPPLLSVS
jgi:hypothetical protein